LPFLSDVEDGVAFYKKENPKSPLPIDSPFDIVQVIVIAAIFADGSVDDAEYEVYETFCRACHYKPLNGDELVKVMETLARQKDHELLNSCLGFAIMLRKAEKDQEVYHHFLLGLWCLLFANDTLTEKEYGILTLFYDQKSDVIPSFSEAKKALA
jgi:hypothetical protein